MAFLDEARAVTESIRGGRIPSLDEIRDLKRRNRELAEKHELEEAAYCDHLPTWINQTNSTVCNLRCDFCNQAYGRGVDWRMDEAIYRQIVEELYPFVETVQLTAYGEPMMTPKIREKIEDMERYGVKLEMVSNATLMKGERLLATMAKVMGLLTVSIDGATKETYDAIRVGGDFDQVVANIRAYNEQRHQLPKANQAPLHFNYIIMKRTIAELPRFLELAAELDAQHVTVMHLVVFEDAMKEETLDNHRELTNRYLREAAEVAERLSLSVRLPPLFALDGEDEEEAPAGPLPERCYFLWRRMYLGPFGDVIPCCLSGIHKNGNMKGETIASVWNNRLYQEMRRRVHSDNPYKPCRDCYLINRRTDTGEFDRRKAATEKA